MSVVHATGGDFPVLALFFSCYNYVEMNSSPFPAGVGTGQFVTETLALPDAVGRERVQQQKGFVLRQLTQFHARASHAQRHPVQHHATLPQHAASSHGPQPGSVQPAQ